jgi:transposase
MYQSRTVYSDEELLKIKEEYLNTNITLKELKSKYNPSTKFISSLHNLKSKFPSRDDRPKEEWDRIIEYYKNNDVTYSQMMEMFNMSTFQCNYYLANTKGRKVYKKYNNNLTKEQWKEVDEMYLNSNTNYNEISEKFNISIITLVKRYKGSKGKDIKVGDKYNRLEIINLDVPRKKLNKQSRRRVEVKCECGTIKTILLFELTSGKIKSCGCYYKKSLCNTFGAKGNTAAGLRTYRSWINMKRRCNNPKSHNYPYYGGRGIKVCERWLDPEYGYKNFKEDMGERPENTTLDRIDVNGNYEPSNCRWADPQLQILNQRRHENTKPISEEEWDIIKKDYVENNLLCKDVVEKYGIKISRVHRYLRGIKKTRGKPTK